MGRISVASVLLHYLLVVIIQILVVQVIKKHVMFIQIMTFFAVIF
jgi:hypothetical protein